MKPEEKQIVYAVYEDEGGTLSTPSLDKLFLKKENAENYIKNIPTTYVIYSIEEIELE